jgi:hypothetical protein
MKEAICLTSKISISSLISDNKIKQANINYQVSAYEHYTGYLKLIPYLQLFKSLNPGFMYCLEKHGSSNLFKRLALIFPYSIAASKHCFKVYGIDAAHISKFEIKCKQRHFLCKAIGKDFPKSARLRFSKCFIFALTGRTVNNEMILFGICIAECETMDNYDFFFQFLESNEVKCILYI